MDNIMPKRPLWGLRGCRLLPLLLADFYSYIAAQPKAKLAKVFLPLTAASHQSATDYSKVSIKRPVLLNVLV